MGLFPIISARSMDDAAYGMYDVRQYVCSLHMLRVGRYLWQLISLGLCSLRVPARAGNINHSSNYVHM